MEQQVIELGSQEVFPSPPVSRQRLFRRAEMFGGGLIGLRFVTQIPWVCFVTQKVWRRCFRGCVLERRFPPLIALKDIFLEIVEIDCHRVSATANPRKSGNTHCLPAVDTKAERIRCPLVRG